MKWLLGAALILTGCQFDPVSIGQPAQQPPTSPEGDRTVAEVPDSELILAIHEQINQYRREQNLPPLSLDATISEQAKQHSQNMARGDTPFSHQGFDSRAKTISQTLPYRRVSENVALNSGHRDPARIAVEGWLNSPGHRQNIEGDFALTGIGVARNSQGEYYFTQIFVQPR